MKSFLRTLGVSMVLLLIVLPTKWPAAQTEGFDNGRLSCSQGTLIVTSPIYPAFATVGGNSLAHDVRNYELYVTLFSWDTAKSEWVWSGEWSTKAIASIDHSVGMSGVGPSWSFYDGSGGANNQRYTVSTSGYFAARLALRDSASSRDWDYSWADTDNGYSWVYCAK